MRAANRALNICGVTAFVFAVLLASPGVDVSQAEENFSYDPALEPDSAIAQPGPAALGDAYAYAGPEPIVAPAASCSGHAVAGPEAIVATSPFSRRAPASARRALEGMPLLIAGEDGEALNSINGRGYNIGKSEPSADLQKLVFEARRQAHARH